VGQIELAITLVAFTFVIVLVTAQLGLRVAFTVGMVWAQEVAQLAVLIAYFFGASYIFKARQYVILSFFVERMPTRFQLAVYLLAQALTFGFCSLLVIELIGIAPAQLRMGTYILHIPRFYSSLPLIVAAASIAITSAYYAITAIRVTRETDGPWHIDELEARINLFSCRTHIEVAS